MGTLSPMAPIDTILKVATNVVHKMAIAKRNFVLSTN